MLFIVESVKTYLIPGSVEFLVVGLIVAVLLLHGRGRASRLGRVLLMTLTITYLLLSLPLGPSVLVWGLTRGATPIPTQRAAEGATAVVVLSGGSGTYSAQGRAIELISGTSALRVLETARIYHMLSDPLVITTGGITAPNRQTKPGATLLKNVLTPLGVPASRIIPETKSLNNREHALFVAPILHEHGVERFVLVTSPTHISRAVRTFEALGLQPVPSISQTRIDTGRLRGGWLPRRENLSVSHKAIYGYFGLHTTGAADGSREGPGSPLPERDASLLVGPAHALRL